MKKEIKGNAGKGSARRQENFKRIQENWDIIQWKPKQFKNKYGK